MRLRGAVARLLPRAADTGRMEERRADDGADGAGTGGDATPVLCTLSVTHRGRTIVSWPRSASWFCLDRAPGPIERGSSTTWAFPRRAGIRWAGRGSIAGSWQGGQLPGRGHAVGCQPRPACRWAYRLDLPETGRRMPTGGPRPGYRRRFPSRASPRSRSTRSARLWRPGLRRASCGWMQATAPTRACAPRSRPWDWPTSRASSRTRALGRRGPGRCRPSHGPDAAADQPDAARWRASPTPRQGTRSGAPRRGLGDDHLARGLGRPAYLGLRAGAGPRRPPR